MAADFAEFKPLIIPLEGDKLTNISGDDGGLTKYGITKASYPDVDVTNLTFDEACTIWESDYWSHYGLSRLNSQDIANKVMSYLMNQNPYSAIRNIQRAINHCGGNVVNDGLLGLATIQALNTLPQDWLLDRIRIEGVSFYLFRVKVEPKDIKFLEGWCNRALA